jgi:hypothetical protein
MNCIQESSYRRSKIGVTRRIRNSDFPKMNERKEWIKNNPRQYNKGGALSINLYRKGRILF